MRPEMIAFRERMEISIGEMAAICKCSAFLLEEIEREDWRTHPKIAARIAQAYQMDVNGYNSLVPADYRAEQIPAPEPPPDERNWVGWTDYYERSVKLENYKAIF